MDNDPSLQAKREVIREVMEVMRELPKDAVLPKDTVVELMILAWLRGASWIMERQSKVQG